MSLSFLLLLFLIGCLIGLLVGFFGVGGGVLMVPILLYLYGNIGFNTQVLTQIAFGTSLFIMIFASMSSAIRHNINKNVVWKAVLIIGISSMLSAYLGSAIAANLKGEVLQKIFAAILIITAIRMLIDIKNKKEKQLNLNFFGLTIPGIIVGFISALSGLGGGVFSIPIMVYLFNFPMKKAVGTSSAIIVITAFSGALGYIINGINNPLLPPGTIGFVDYQGSIAIILGSIPLSQVGAHFSNKTKSNILKKLFAIFLLVIAIKIFIF
jgi:hypothetical protein